MPTRRSSRDCGVLRLSSDHSLAQDYGKGNCSRRQFLGGLAAAAVLSQGAVLRAGSPPLKLKYLLASALFGDMPVDTILPEVQRTGSLGIDLWCKPHGTQREQAQAMGMEKFNELLQRSSVRPVCFTQYPLGPFALQPEMKVLHQLGGELMVTGSRGPKNLAGAELKQAIQKFLEELKPHADKAAELQLTIAIENHASSLLNHPDSLRYWAECNRHPALGIAFAPHHLHDHIDQIPQLIEDLGVANLPFVYFQEHGIGSQQKVAKEIELQQLPGRGTLDYLPLLRALRKIEFRGWAEIFMHPTPRGVPILPTADEIAAALNQSRTHLETLVKNMNGE